MIKIFKGIDENLLSDEVNDFIKENEINDYEIKTNTVTDGKLIIIIIVIIYER